MPRAATGTCSSRFSSATWTISTETVALCGCSSRTSSLATPTTTRSITLAVALATDIGSVVALPMPTTWLVGPITITCSGDDRIRPTR
jgi:hypothetical protein